MILHNNATRNRWGPVLRPTGLRARGRLGTLEDGPDSSGRLQKGSVALQGSSGKVTGGFGSFKSNEHQELVIILHMNAAGNRQGPVLRPAGLRARGRLGPLERSPDSSRRLQEVLWRFKEALGRLQEVLGASNQRNIKNL